MSQANLAKVPRQAPMTLLYKHLSVVGVFFSQYTAGGRFSPCHKWGVEAQPADTIAEDLTKSAAAQGSEPGS